MPGNQSAPGTASSLNHMPVCFALPALGLISSIPFVCITKANSPWREREHSRQLLDWVQKQALNEVCFSSYALKMMERMNTRVTRNGNVSKPGRNKGEKNILHRRHIRTSPSPDKHRECTAETQNIPPGSTTAPHPVPSPFLQLPLPCRELSAFSLPLPAPPRVQSALPRSRPSSS